MNIQTNSLEIYEKRLSQNKKKIIRHIRVPTYFVSVYTYIYTYTNARKYA